MFRVHEKKDSFMKCEDQRWNSPVHVVKERTYQSEAEKKKQIDINWMRRNCDGDRNLQDLLENELEHKLLEKKWMQPG